MTEHATNVPRFLVVAPLGRDGELICGLLNGAGYRSERVPEVRNVEGIDSALLLGLILTDEALLRGGIEALQKIIHAQPAWSELPSSERHRTAAALVCSRQPVLRRSGAL